MSGERANMRVQAAAGNTQMYVDTRNTWNTQVPPIQSSSQHENDPLKLDREPSLVSQPSAAQVSDAGGENRTWQTIMCASFWLVQALKCTDVLVS